MEEWRDIPGYEGIYEASSLGQIRSKAGKTTYSDRHGVRHWRERILKQKICRNKKGRCDARVDLWKNGVHKTFLVSRLVAMTWVDGYEPELTVNHRDGNSLNNRAQNLEWLSRADNIKQGFEDGLYHNCCPICLKSGDMMLLHNSLAEASRALGRNNGYVHDCLKNHRPIISASGVKYKVSGEEHAGKEAIG